MDSLEQTMYWLLSGSKGSVNRLKILEYLEKKPSNMNELSKAMNINYKTTQHHIELLTENNLLVSKGNNYGQVYFHSEALQSKHELLHALLRALSGSDES